jgi:hypothetical protein
MADLSNVFPTSQSFTTVDFRIVSPGIASETNSGKLRRVSQGISYYAWNVKFPPITPRDFGEIIGFVSQTFGQTYSFEIIIPEVSYTATINQANSAVTVGNIAGPGAINVAITCGSINANKEVLRAGDFFKFNNHSKVYMATVNCTANASGNATLFFSGSTVSNVAPGTALTINAVPFTAVLDGGEQEYNIGSGGLLGLELDMREVW